MVTCGGHEVVSVLNYKGCMTQKVGGRWICIPDPWEKVRGSISNRDSTEMIPGNRLNQ